VFNGLVNTCPFPIGWLMNIDGVSSEEKKHENQQVSMMIDVINQLPAPLFLPKGHQIVIQVHHG